MRRAAFGMFFERERLRQQQRVSTIDAQGAVELVGKFDGFSGVAAVVGQRWQSDRVCAEGDSVVGGDDAVIAQAEATGQLEAAGKRRKSEAASAAGRAKRRL